MQFDADDIASFEAVDLLSSLDDEDDACTFMNGPDTTSPVVAPDGDTSISSSGSFSSVAPTDPQSQTEGVARHNVSGSGLLSVVSEDSVAQTAVSSDTISATAPPNAHTSVSVTLSTASFTITWTSHVHNNTASSTVGGNLTTLTSATPSNPQQPQLHGHLYWQASSRHWQSFLCQHYHLAAHIDHPYHS